MGHDDAVTTPQFGPCGGAARRSMSQLLQARVQSGGIFCSQTPLLAPSSVGEEAGWKTVLHESGLGCVKGG